jgi:anthranilate synthase/aminodeoxychorismate synthase-like glutamine amidotransferase
VVHKKLILIDHYDSFTYLINDYFKQLGVQTEVIQQDDPILYQMESLNPSCIVFSPGPGHPVEATVTLDVIRRYHHMYPMLGICLGHQALALAFGGQVIHASLVVHGKQSLIYHDQQGLFHDLPSPFRATRYHSLMVEEQTLPKDFKITAWTVDANQNKVIMGMQHCVYPLFGVQYHPEAILTEHGFDVFRQFLRYC